MFIFIMNGLIKWFQCIYVYNEPLIKRFQCSHIYNERSYEEVPLYSY